MTHKSVLKRSQRYGAVRRGGVGRAASRRGITLLEILFSIFVLLSGFLGMAILLLVGTHHSAVGMRLERAGECAKAGSQDVARFQRATLQVFVCDHVEHGQSHGARNRVATKRAEELHAVVERVGNRASGHDGRDPSVLAWRL